MDAASLEKMGQNLTKRIEAAFDGRVGDFFPQSPTMTMRGIPYVAVGLCTADEDCLDALCDAVFMGIVYGDFRALKLEGVKVDRLHSPKGKRLIWRTKPNVHYHAAITGPFTDPLTGKIVKVGEPQLWVIYCRFALEQI